MKIAFATAAGLMILLGTLSGLDGTVNGAAAQEYCKWFGTKPFCNGQCPARWRYTGQRRSCTTGSQRYCCTGIPETKTFPQEFGTDRPGSDYTHFTYSSSFSQSQQINGCQASCRKQWPQCKAWTWVRPGVQGPSARCWLKSAAPAPRSNNCCVSGVISD
jgi:hypothetical protein